MKKLLLLLLFIPLVSFSQKNIDECDNKIAFENDIYVGCIDKDGNPDGYGIMTYENKDVYKGYWENGKKNGLGKYVTNEGNSYEGYWKENMKHGKGSSTEKKEDETYFRKGLFEYGQFIEGKMEVDNGYFSTQHNITYKSYIGVVKNKEINLFEGPGPDYEIIENLIPGSELFIISDKDINGYYNVIDVLSNKEGYVNILFVDLGNEIKANDESSNLMVTGVSENPNFSIINIFNNTKVRASIKIGGSNYIFEPDASRDIEISPGDYKIIVSSLNMIPIIEKIEIEIGKNYKWEHVITKNL